MTGYIYSFTNQINNKKYIGSTINKPSIRYSQHIYDSIHPESHQYNYPLQNALRKYGKDNFIFEILEEYKGEEQKLRIIEKNYILLYNTLCPNGYNQTTDTEHPINDVETYVKIRETKREHAQKVALIDDNNNIIQTWRSIIDCAEALHESEKKIAACCRGERLSTGGKRFCWLDKDNNIIINTYHRDPYKGEQGTTQIQSTSKKVAKLDDNDNILNIYPTVALAARENQCDASSISKVCRGLRNKTGGYKWKYVE